MRDETLRKALSYTRFSRSLPKVLVLAAQYFIVDDVIDCAKRLGWSVSSIPTPTHGLFPRDFLVNLLETLVRHQPDFIITLNHFGFDEEGKLAELLDGYQVPVASWFVDHPMAILPQATKAAVPTCQIFSFERQALLWLKTHGFIDPVYLPTGTNAAFFHPQAVDAKKMAAMAWPLTFVGNSWWQKAREEPEEWAQKAARAYLNQYKEDADHFIDDLEKQLQTLPGILPHQRYTVAQVIIAEMSMQRRAQVVSHLQHFNLRLYGDEHWKKLVPQVDLRKPLDYWRDLPALYAASQVNLNISSLHIQTAINQRVWDVPAVNGFLLTDHQSDVLEYFCHQREVVTYSSLEEAADMAHYFLKRPAARQPIAARAFSKVHHFHRLENRLNAMLEVMRQRFQ